VAAADLVVTNAHVVAGISEPSVIDAGGGRHGSVVVYFDPRFDLAVLRTSSLNEPALYIDPSPVNPGSQAAVVGYPGSGPFQAGPAEVIQGFSAQDSDIYGHGATTRRVYAITGTVRPGNSGGPLVEATGKSSAWCSPGHCPTPISATPWRPPEVATRVAQAETHASNTTTGSCASRHGAGQ